MKEKITLYKYEMESGIKKIRTKILRCSIYDLRSQGKVQ
jgi:hypothetical protein